MSRTGSILAAVILVLIFVPKAGAAGCGDTEQDRIVWARERMRDGVTPEDLRLVYQWLLNGTSSCNESGDLWYYRSLVAARMKNTRDAGYALGKSREYHSRAQGDGFDPFAPVARTLAAVKTTPGKPRNKFALLVGVTNLQKSFDFLEFSGKDARELGGFLVKEGHFPPENVEVLTDEMATTRNIREGFGKIRAKAKADDLVLIYISSHGRARELDPTGLSYVMTYDTDMGTQAKTFATALQMVEIAELGRWTLARDYVLLLDTCYSGSAKPGVASASSDPLQGLQGAGNRAVIAASRADERSYEDPEHQHGLFTRFLLDGLKENSSLSLGALYDYVGMHVSQALGADKQQHPVAQYFGDANGIVLDTPLNVARTRELTNGNSAFLVARAGRPDVSR